MTTKKYNTDQLYAICDHLNAANTLAMNQHISKAIIDLDQLSDITDSIAALADEIYNAETKTFSTSERL